MMQYHMLQKEPVERALLKLEMEKEGVSVDYHSSVHACTL